MIKVVKEFIEQHIELLDKNPQEFFFRAWKENILDRADVGYMSAILYEAGISSDDINSWREGALIDVLDTCMDEFASDDSSISSMPVYDFIQAYMDNCVGYNENYVLLFIQKHAERWDNYIELYKENNMTIISRR